MHVPVDELRARLDEIPIGRPAVVCCHAGLRGLTAARILTRHGRSVRNPDGGWLTWQAGQTRP
ncbi:rhodanese-like domain-containing protein [Streptomyces sp. NPDC048385]|uniref:rhodanese-like domain-containing protein n=1 Tax=unclassified Streptomyces TaxID=2593676 RepID=UPI00342DB9CF